MTKEKVIERVNKLPKEFSLDDLVEELVLIEKVEIGLKQSEQNQVISEEELDKEVNKWFE